MKMRLYLGVILATLTSGGILPAQTLLPAETPIEQAVDHYLDAALKEAGANAATPADDATLLRRLTLDLNGRIPTPAEVRAYLASTEADKRVKLVDRLLAVPAFARHQAAEFETLLLGSSRDLMAGNKKDGGRSSGLRDYLQGAFAENRSWDRLFRELMLPDESDPKQKGAGDFLRTHVRDLDKLTNEVSTVFFGVNVSCAQCHDHPLVQDWKQDHFYGMKSFLARTHESGGFLAERDFGVVKFIPNKGKEKLARPMFLTGKTVEVPGLQEPTKEEQQKDRERIEAARKANKAPPAPAFSVRAKLVELALEPGQRDFLARAIVNRLWQRLFGMGLVTPLDQMHSENPPSHPELLQWLARDLVEQGYDLRRLLRGLVLSQGYGRASRWDGANLPAPKLFAVAQVRPLTPTQLATSLRLAASDPVRLPAGDKLEKRLEATDKASGGVAGLFAQPGESFQVSVAEALLFSNGDVLLKEFLNDAPDRLVARLKEIKELDRRVDAAVRAVLSRPARPEEVVALTDYLRRREDRPVAACQQMVWALMASAEFRFNH